MIGEIAYERRPGAAAHGSGGRMSQQLIENVFKQAWITRFGAYAGWGGAGAAGREAAMTTDSFVITPIFSPAEIWETVYLRYVNDLVACRGPTLYLSTAFIIEEGFLWMN